jgi:DNA (cytosine-5)-methyltransferase 1
VTYRIGSLCSGYEGLGMAVQAVLGGELAWVADNDPGAAAILAHRFPGVPNLGDISKTNWAALTAVDVMCMGFPCTDVSCAGAREGLREGNRSGVWNYCAGAIGALRPPLILIENVRGLHSAGADSNVEWCPWCLGEAGDEHALRASGAVLGDLADLGYDARWVTVSASDAGAPHRRDRVFIVAWPAADTDDLILAAEPRGVARRAAGGQRGDTAADWRPADRGHDAVAAHAERDRRPGRHTRSPVSPDARGAGSRPETAGRGPVAPADAAGGGLAAGGRAGDGRPAALGGEAVGRPGYSPAEDPDRAAGGERREPAPV